MATDELDMREVSEKSSEGSAESSGLATKLLEEFSSIFKPASDRQGATATDELSFTGDNLERPTPSEYAHHGSHIQGEAQHEHRTVSAKRDVERGRASRSDGSHPQSPGPEHVTVTFRHTPTSADPIVPPLAI